jgi:hypothetical protein
MSIKNLRSVFNPIKYPWTSRAAASVARKLLEGHIVCRDCNLLNATSGIVLCNQTFMDKHAQTQQHIDAAANRAAAVAASVAQQVDLVAVGGVVFVPPPGGVREEVASALCAGHLIAGGDGAAGLPYSSTTVHMSQEFIRVR